MSTDSDSKPGSLENGVAPDSAAMQRMIEETVGKALAARLPRVKGTEETIAKMVADAVAKFQPQLEAPKAPGDNASESEKLTLKGLKEQIAALHKGIDEERKARSQAEQAAEQTKLNAEIRAHFSRHLGSESPHLEPYVNHYRGQFQIKDGQVYRTVRGEYGDEQIVPAGKAVEDLFGSELKFLTQQSKAAQLPPAQWNNRAVGQPVNQSSNPQEGQRRPNNPLLATIAQGIAEERPEAAQLLMNDANRIPIPASVNRK